MGNSGSSSLHQAPGKLGDYQSYYRTQIAGSDGYNRIGGVGGVVVGEGSASGDRFASHKRSFSTNSPTQQQQQQQQSSFGWRSAGNTNLIWDYPQQRPHQQLHNDHDHHLHHHLHQPQPQQLHPKVLPTNFDRSFRLRSTKNGTILNTGGTLSGRKDSGSSSTPRMLQRSKTDLEKSQLLLSNRKCPNFRRSQTQISLDVDGDVDAATLATNGGDQWRRSRRRRRFQMMSSAAAAAAAQVSMSAEVDDFGESQLRTTTTTMYLSEPDLRSSVRLGDANGGRRGGGGGTSGGGNRDQMCNHETVVNRFASRKTKIKNKKRKAPLAPPAAPPLLLPPARAPPSPPPPLPPTTKAAQTADATNERTKLRLFKTRIESTPSAGGVTAKCEGGATAAAASCRAAPLPYRREKSFDAKLLLNDRHDHYQYVDDPHQQHRHHVSPPSTPATPRPTTTTTRIPQLKKSFYFGMDSVNSVKKPITAAAAAAAATTTTKTTKSAVIRSVRGATESGLFAAVASAGGADVVDVVTETFRKSPGLAMVATTTYRGDGDDGDDDDDDDDDDDSESNDDEFRISAKCPRGGGGGGGGGGNNTVCTTMNDNGLRVHLYPTLPRRQLEVPRFSPAAAWRTLNENIASVSASANANATTASTINHELDLFQISNLVRSIPSLSADDDGAAAAAAADSANSVKEKPISCTYRDPRSLNLERCLLDAGGGGVDDNCEDDDDGGDGDGDGDSDISTDDALLWMSPSDFCRRRQQQQQKNHNNNNNTMQQQHPMTSATQLVPPGPFLAPWTPQQDLDDDSSSDGDSSFTKFNRNNPIAGNTADTTAAATITNIAAVAASSTLFGCGHVFSLSLPRDHHNHHQQQQNEHQSLGSNGISSMAITDKKNGFSSLQKLKRTISGGDCAGQQSPTKTKTTSATTTAAAADNNWVFGRTVFGLDDNKERRALKSRSDDDRRTSLSSPDRHHQQPTSLTLVTAGKHVMYLPNNFIPSTKASKTDANDTVIDARWSKATTTNTTIATATNLLKPPPPSAGKSPSISTEHKRSSLENLFSSNRRQRKDGQLSSCVISETGSFGASSLAASKGQRFSFQSTVRQIERRRLAEKLSKDAELKEAQRKSELEVMRRVEEDFQRKRAHEKANIRQQLRLYSSIENKSRDFLSLPFDGGCGVGEGGDDSLAIAMQQQQQQKPANLPASDSDSENRADVGDGETFRADPDGAVSSVSSSSPLSFQNQAADAGKSTTMTTTRTPAKLLN